MKRLLMAWLTLLLCARGVAGGDGCEQREYSEPCWQKGERPCVCHPAQKQAQENAQQAQGEQAAAGAFAAPPPVGTVEGATRSVGIQGGAVHFPAITLRLPTLQLPSLSRFRSDARIRIDAAEAPFVGQALGVAAGAPVAFQAANVAQLVGTQQLTQVGSQAVAGAQGQDQGAQAQEEPTCSGGKGQEIEQKLQMLHEQEQRMNEKLKRLEECLREFQSSQDTRSSGRALPAVSYGPGTPEPSRLALLPKTRFQNDGLVLLPAAEQETKAMVKQSSFLEAESLRGESLHHLPPVDVRRLPPANQ